MAVVRVCREVRLIPTTLVTLVVRCHPGNSNKITADKVNEREDDVRSLWPLYSGLQALYNGKHNG